MARYFARIIRAIVVSGLGFGGGIGLLTLIAILVTTGNQAALGVALNAAIWIGLLFGLFSAALLLLSDLTGRLFAAKGLHDEIWELEQVREIKLSGTFREARSMSRTALLAVPAVKAVSDDEDEFRINAAIGASWKSPGEKMHIQIEPDGDENSWKIRCTSSCMATNVAFDYGKNFENVESWLRTMRSLMTQGGDNSEDRLQSSTS